MNNNYQSFSYNKNVYSSPNFFPDDSTKSQPQPTPLPEDFSTNPYSRKNEDLIKDTLSNIEEVGNHSFNSGHQQNFLQSSAPRSHFLDDQALSKKGHTHMQYSVQNPHLTAFANSQWQNYEIRSDINVNVNQKNDDFLKILDSNDLSVYGDQKNKVNFNELTIQPDLETRSVYYGNEGVANRNTKHGPYSVDMGNNQVFELELQKDQFLENNMNPPHIMSHFSTNSISEKKMEKKNSTHHKGYSGEYNITGFNVNNIKSGENKKELSSENFGNYVDYAKNNQEFKPNVTKFVDIFKNFQPNPQQTASNFEKKEVSQPVKKGLPPLFKEEKKTESERTSPEHVTKNFVRPILESPETNFNKAPVLCTPKITINGSQFSANQRNIFEIDMNIRESIDLEKSNRLRNDSSSGKNNYFSPSANKTQQNQNSYNVEQFKYQNQNLDYNQNPQDFGYNNQNPQSTEQNFGYTYNNQTSPQTQQYGYNMQPQPKNEDNNNQNKNLDYNNQNQNFGYNEQKKIDQNNDFQQKLQNFAPKIEESIVSQKSKFVSSPLVETPLIDPVWKLDYFEMGASLGRGKFSSVYIARDKRTKFIVALKIIQKQILKETGAEKALAQEIKIQSLCDHPNILKLYGYFDQEEKIVLVLEYAAHGQLFNELKLQPQRRFDEIKAASYIRQILQALQYLHYYEIMHRDIKPENIMISHGVLKLSDFGWAAYCPINQRRETFCGTLDYVSPEVVEGHPYDYSVDIWSLGVLCYELCEGKPPFLHDSTSETYLRILNCVMEIPGHFSAELKDLMRIVFKKNPEERPKINELMLHPWFQIGGNNAIDQQENSLFSKIMTL